MTPSRTRFARRAAAVAAAAVALPTAFTAGVAHAAAITPGDVVVLRDGSGTGNLVNSGSPLFLDEYTPAGSLVQSVALPTAASGSNQPCLDSGVATSDGLITLSTDSKSILVSCYGTAGGGSSLTGTTSASVPRVVATVDVATGAVDTTTALSDSNSANNVRSVAGTSAASFYVGGGANERLAVRGATTSTAIASLNTRQLQIVNGNLYYSTGSGTAGVYQLGSGLPTGTSTGTELFPSSSPYGFALLDLDGNGVPDTAYVADDSANAVTKFTSSNGTTWTAKGSVTFTGARGLTTSVSNGNVTVYATTGGSTATGGGSIVSISDPNALTSTLSGSATTVATAAANTAFRGIVSLPAQATTTPPTPSLPEAPYAVLLPLVAVSAIGGIVMMRRRAA